VDEKRREDGVSLTWTCRMCYFSSLFFIYVNNLSSWRSMQTQHHAAACRRYPRKDGVSASTTSFPTIYHLQPLRRSTGSSHLAKSSSLNKIIQEAICETCKRQEFYAVSALIHLNLHSLCPFVPVGSYAMPSILRALKLTRDPSDASFAAGDEAWMKYKATRESQYLVEAVRNHQAALDIRVLGHPRRSNSLFATAMALWAHCQGAVTKEISSTVIAYYDEALRLLPDKPTKLRVTIYTNLGMVYFTLFRLGKEDPEGFPDTGPNIGKAIENYRSALQVKPAKNDPGRPSSLINLSIALVQKDRKDDLMNAIITLREAVELCTASHWRLRLLLLSLNDLVQAYDSHHRYSEDISDVVGKVDALRRVLGLMDDGKGWLVPLVNLTNALWRICEIEPKRSNDLDEAVLRGREALKLSDGSDKIIHAKVLITLADILSARYAQISPKNVMDLDQAIQYYREAIDPDPEDGPDPILCNNLASAISIRCRSFKEVKGATLEDAISYSQEALHTCPKDDPLYLKIQNNLGSIYLTQFIKSGAEDDLVKGIQAYEDAVSHCPDDNVDFTYYEETLENLKRALQDKRGRETGKVSINTKSKLHRRWSVEAYLRSRLTRHQPTSPTDKRGGETGKISISTKSKLRHRQSVGSDLQSSDESCTSTPASIIERD
jgi:tetratricopeptide (TPR) repeat protein